MPVIKVALVGSANRGLGSMSVAPVVWAGCLDHEPSIQRWRRPKHRARPKKLSMCKQQLRIHIQMRFLKAHTLPVPSRGKTRLCHTTHQPFDILIAGFSGFSGCQISRQPHNLNMTAKEAKNWLQSRERGVCQLLFKKCNAPGPQRDL
jgi:hypothetical protein